jgi:hypothetical protein
VDLQPPEAEAAAAGVGELEGDADLGLGHAELRPAQPDRETGMRLRCHVGVEPEQRVDGGAGANGEPGEHGDLVG